MHLGSLAMSGAGILTLEASAVSPEGRITYADVGLFDDACEHTMASVLASVRRWSDMPIAIQLAHAGRKASCEVPWDGGNQIAPSAPNGWQTVAPSPIGFRATDQAPVELDADGLRKVRDDFAAAAQRAARLGLDAIQVHAAHGYLLHEFLSPVSNRRSDEYGGSLENRMRFPLEVFEVVRAHFPADKPVSVRISATDWVDGGWDIEQSVAFARALEARGWSAIHVSSGGNAEHQEIPVGPGYQVPFARAVTDAVSIPVVAVGLITEAAQAEKILTDGDADLIGVARAILYDPHWPWHCAAELGGSVRAPKQYLRSQPSGLRDLLKAMARPSR